MKELSEFKPAEVTRHRDGYLFRSFTSAGSMESLKKPDVASKDGITQKL